MHLLRPWRWFRAAIVELTGVAACLLLIGFSQAARTPQLNEPPQTNHNAVPQTRDTGDHSQSSDEELWQILSAVVEKALK